MSRPIEVSELLRSLGVAEGQDYKRTLDALDRAAFALNAPLQYDGKIFIGLAPVDRSDLDPDVALKLIDEMERQSKRDWFAEARKFVEDWKKDWP